MNWGLLVDLPEFEERSLVHKGEVGVFDCCCSLLALVVVGMDKGNLNPSCLLSQGVKYKFLLVFLLRKLRWNWWLAGLVDRAKEVEHFGDILKTFADETNKYDWPWVSLFLSHPVSHLISFSHLSVFLSLCRHTPRHLAFTQLRTCLP